MARAITHLSLIERTVTKLAEPDTLEAICAHTANGGSLLELCELWHIRYSDVQRWLYDKGVREQTYAAAMAARGEWFVQRLLDELKTLGLSNPKAFFRDDGNLRPLKEIPDALACTIAGIDIETRTEGRGEEKEYVTTKRIKLVDKLRAIELIGKHLRMFIDRVEHSGALKLEDLYPRATATMPPHG